MNQKCIFDRETHRSGPTNYLVGFQNQGFTQRFTKNTKKLKIFLKHT